MMGWCEAGIEEAANSNTLPDPASGPAAPTPAAAPAAANAKTQVAAIPNHFLITLWHPISRDLYPIIRCELRNWEPRGCKPVSPV